MISVTHFIETQNPPQLVVFCRTKHQTDRVAEVLKRKNMSAGAIHGDLPQTKRERILALAPFIRETVDGYLDRLAAAPRPAVEDLEDRALDECGLRAFLRAPEDGFGHQFPARSASARLRKASARAARCLARSAGE